MSWTPTQWLLLIVGWLVLQEVMGDAMCPIVRLVERHPWLTMGLTLPLGAAAGQAGLVWMIEPTGHPQKRSSSRLRSAQSRLVAGHQGRSGSAYGLPAPIVRVAVLVAPQGHLFRGRASARECGKTLLVLDTARGEAERLYERLGWVRCRTDLRHCLAAAGQALRHDGVLSPRQLRRRRPSSPDHS